MDGSSAEAEAEAEAHRYQSLFSDVAGISSRELLSDSLLSSSNTKIQPNWSFHDHKVLLVDVRTEKERDVSMISGAVSLDEFKTNVLPLLEAKSGVDDSALPDMIITYCTIGYRSGVEARKLIHEYPRIFIGWENDDEDADPEECIASTTKVANLDGIIPFANAICIDYEEGQSSERTPIEPLIINRKTNTATKKVHVYGPSWKKFLSPTYDASTFSQIEFAWRGLLVLARSCLSCNINNCACCKKK